MTRGQRVVGAVVTAAILSVAAAAHGDPLTQAPLTSYLHMRTPIHVITDGGSDIHLPPGYFLDEPTFGKLDTEVRRLQTAEVRLTAENKSMRQSLSGWEPGWYTLAIATVSGIAAGWYLHEHI